MKHTNKLQFDEDVQGILDELKSREGAELVSGITELFVQRLDADISDVKNGILKNSLVILGDKAHFLYSTFNTFGFKTGKELSELIEEKCKITKDISVLDEAHQLVAYLEFLKEELK